MKGDEMVKADGICITSQEQLAALLAAEEDLYEGYQFQELDFHDCVSVRPKTEFSHCSFYKCKLTDIRLEHCFFVDTVFEKCDFSNSLAGFCSLQRVTFQSCKMLGADWSDGVFRNVRFIDTMARYSNFTHSKFEDTLFSQCDLTEAVLEQCALKRFRLQECMLQGTIFFRTILKNIDLSTCNIARIRVGLGDLKGAVIEANQVFDLAALLEVKIK
ncbi:MAG: pentapeptide repeat-containing protein [Peptococcaceae bacterium]|jgi:uncharacterized protein YjbI with pentapeptide repeats|nr:pentapeptide repeat-containing protein [Peptococcaceae bacterium]